MSSESRLGQEATVSATNIGGIAETTVSLEPGVNVLAGRNATNRTSFLQAIMAGLGSDNVSIKGDAEEAAVSIDIGGRTYSRKLSRSAGDVSAHGDSFLDDPELGDLFAFLLESNEARRTVATEGHLRDIIMRPVDLTEINAEIDALENQKQRIDTQIEQIEHRKEELPTLEATRSSLQEEIQATREQLQSIEADIQVADADISAKRDDKQELERKLSQLQEARTDLEDARYEIETERESLQSLKQDRSRLQSKIETIQGESDMDIDELSAEIEHLREQRHDIDSQLSSLQSTIQFNEEMLDGGRADVPRSHTTSGSPTDQLLPTDQVVCWTCGSEVAKAAIESTLDELRSVRQDRLEEKRRIAESLDELQTKQQSLEQRVRRRDHLQQRLGAVEDELSQRQERLETLRSQRSEYERVVKDLEAAVESLESTQFEAILDRHREANQLQYEIGRLEEDLEDVETDIVEIESQLEVLGDLETERETVTDELLELRTRVERLEEQAVDSFNKHMDELLATLAYENIERIWIERVQREVREGRRKSSKTMFELHVVRSSPSGTTYEDTIDHLSESEREVTGLVFALAGYLVHDVHETVPFMLLDSLEAIDSERIAALVSYFSDYAEYLVVALLPEDAQALDASYHRIDSI